MNSIGILQHYWQVIYKHKYFASKYLAGNYLVSKYCMSCMDTLLAGSSQPTYSDETPVGSPHREINVQWVIDTMWI